MKSSDGCAAVRMAREGQWDKLEDYCANDVHILCELYRKHTLNHPHKKGAYIDLQAYAYSTNIEFNVGSFSYTADIYF